MKALNLLKTAVLLSVAGQLCSCSQESGTDKQYIRLSEATISFTAHDTTPYRITVESNPSDWNVEYLMDWVNEIERTPTSLTISVDENNTIYQREGEIVFTAGKAYYTLNVIQLGDYNAAATYLDFTGFQGQVIMSAGGTYVGGLITTLSDDGQSFLYYPTMVETKTKKITQLGPYDYETHMFMDSSALSDQGTIIFDTEFDEQIGVNIDGTTFKVNTIPGHAYPPRIERFSADGRICVGYSVKDFPNGTTLRIPMMWVDGEPFELQMPEKNFRDMKFEYGLMARGISANGEIIYGSTWDNTDFGMVYWDNGGNVHYVGERILTPIQVIDSETNEVIDYNLVNGFISWAGNYNVSPNGTWLAGTWRTEEVVDDTIETKLYPAFFNTKTQQQYILYDFEGLTSFTATDEGLGIIGLATEVEVCYVVDIETMTTLSTSVDYMTYRYDLVVNRGVIQYVAPDNSTMLGFYLANSPAYGLENVYFYISEPSK